MEERRWCPCPSLWESETGTMTMMTGPSLRNYNDFAEHRMLEEELEDEGAPQGETWQMVYMGCVLILMFAALLSDKIGADLVMLAALTLCMAANIVTVSEGISGFSNEGVLTVLVLFIVAAGVQLTGGLDWYMAKLLGKPANCAGAQLRLMIPIATISAFVNNTPVVVIMIPIIQKWGKNMGFSPKQLLVPLSFSSILGGTCTLIGTSTNLVVAGLLETTYPDDPEMKIGMFHLGEFGVPIALVGFAYIIIASPYLLPGGKRDNDTSVPIDDGTILLGARLTKFSPACGRTVKRSGLRDTGGIYLVSVHRALSGNVHRAVGQDFVLNMDDVLYFTGLVNEFAKFCDEHGLEVVTNEEEIKQHGTGEPRNSVINGRRNSAKNYGPQENSHAQEDEGLEENCHEEEKNRVVRFASAEVIMENNDDDGSGSDIESAHSTIATKPHTRRLRGSVLSFAAQKALTINRLTDMIRGFDPSEPLPDDFEDPEFRESRLVGPAQVVASLDTTGLDALVIVGVNANDRPGLLLDISKELHSLGLQLHHTEASVMLGRSISVWRCSLIDDADKEDPNEEEIEGVLRNLLEIGDGIGAAKRGGMSVIRCVVTEKSRLCGKTLGDISFREIYAGGVMAVQKRDKSEVKFLSEVCFESGDILVINADESSALLKRPPPDFYKQESTPGGYLSKFKGRNLSFTDLTGLSKSKSNDALGESIPESTADEAEVSSVDTETTEVWKDLMVIFHGNGDSAQDGGGNTSREFLAATEVSEKSEHIGKTVAQTGLDKQAGLFLVGVERKVDKRQTLRVSFKRTSAMMTSPLNLADIKAGATDENGSVSDLASAITDGDVPKETIPLPPEGHLQAGDILWFAGPAAAMADLRKIPGLQSMEEDELKQIDDEVHDRRLVQAVVAKNGPLTGKTAAEVGFRTQYGAAIIAVSRGGTRVQDHPGKIKLQTGDVLLLEAGPTFISKNTNNQKSFALISEVKDSKPPRLDKLIPAMVLVALMLIIVSIGPSLFPDQNLSSLLVCGLLTAIIMVSFRILSQQECRDAVNWEVYVTIASAFGIGIAMANSGLASVIADGLVSLGNALGIGHAGLYGAVYLGTFLISNVVTNNAAAALMFPIAMDAAEQTGADRLLMSYNLMLAASASFMSPFGYTTNLLIYGSGGYTVKDFLIIGTPMQVILWIFTTFILSNTTTPWWVSWLVSSAMFILVCFVFVFPALIKQTLEKAQVLQTRGLAR